MEPTVTITENGRDGSVLYSEGPLRSINGYWEFGGNDVVTIVNMGSRDDWQRADAWALEQRASILRFVADEMVRQRAPSCTAEIDEERGDILLRQSDATRRATSATEQARRPKPGASSVAIQTSKPWSGSACSLSRF